MTPYVINGPGRLCAVSGRELRPGERLVSVVIEEAGSLVRKDFAADVWPGPPDGAIAWWAGRVPAAGQPRKPPVNDELLLDCFTHLANTTDGRQQNFRYVLALLLMRRKRLKFEDVRKEAGREMLCLRDARSGARFELPDPRLTDDEMTVVQEEVFRLLGWN